MLEQLEGWSYMIRPRKRMADFRLLAAALMALLALPVHGATQGAAAPAPSQGDGDEELVFLDPNGVIKVHDPTQGTDAREVIWESPDGGWRHIAVGDFNADGDAEIAAVGGDGVNRLAIYDPVAEGLGVGEADGFFNGIPWALLYEETLDGFPYLISSGEFSVDAPGDEIIYYFRLPDADRVQQDDDNRFVIMFAYADPPDGRLWSTLLTYDSGNEWTWIGAGNLNGSGADEVALIASEIGNLSVYSIVDGGLVRIKRYSDGSVPWQDGAIGQYIAGGDEELAVGRETVYDAPALFVLQYAGGSWTDAYAQYHDPPPGAVFLGDLTGNGDDELMVVRSVRPELSNVPRLFVKDNGNDTFFLQEHSLDADNGYRTGVAADTDGDGRDEVVVIRNNRIRIFTEPERSASFVDKETGVDTAMILAADLDANGLSGSSRFGASPDSVEESVTAGAVSEVYAIAVSDVVNGNSVPFNYRVENGSAWVQVTRSGARTPTTLSVTLDASELLSGTFSDRILIEASDGSVANSPYAIDVRMTVKPGISLTPGVVREVLTDCQWRAARLCLSTLT